MFIFQGDGSMFGWTMVHVGDQLYVGAPKDNNRGGWGVRHHWEQIIRNHYHEWIHTSQSQVPCTRFQIWRHPHLNPRWAHPQLPARRPGLEAVSQRAEQKSSHAATERTIKVCDMEWGSATKPPALATPSPSLPKPITLSDIRSPRLPMKTI